MPNAFSVNPLFLFGSQGWSAQRQPWETAKHFDKPCKGYSAHA